MNLPFVREFIARNFLTKDICSSICSSFSLSSIVQGSHAP